MQQLTLMASHSFAERTEKVFGMPMRTDADYVEFLRDLNSVTPRQFEEFVAEWVRQLGRGTIYQTGGPRQDLFNADIISEEPNDVYIIQAKFVRSVSQNFAEFIAKNLAEAEVYYAAKFPGKNIKKVVAVSFPQSPDVVNILTSAGVEIWEPDTYLAGSRPTPSAVKPPRTCRDVLKDMIATPAGRGRNALIYQDLAIELFSCVFGQSIELIDREVSDDEGRNRRDAIFENLSPSGPWSVIRQLYNAPYIILDAKNHAGELGKKPILDISHYLKTYGCGCFGVLICRKGASRSAWHAAKEHWIGARKMIITLNHDDLDRAIGLREAGLDPIITIQAKLREFRIAM
ncbi:hypothetical protein [Azospirillum sp.]|uniref:hypothetical protein n=1 Tax=Azospirillum sp. TaxID=34012 RepID=UPI003D713590